MRLPRRRSFLSCGAETFSAIEAVIQLFATARLQRDTRSGVQAAGRVLHTLI